MGLAVLEGAVIACDCGTATARLIALPIHFSINIPLPKIDFSFDLQFPSFNLGFNAGLDLNLDLDVDLNLDLNIDADLDVSLDLDLALDLDFFIEMPSISLSFSLDLSLPAFDVDLDLDLDFSLDVELTIPTLDLDLDLDLDVDFSLPSFEFDVDFSFDFPKPGFALGLPMVTVSAHIPHLNFRPAHFGMCKSRGNPEVVAAGKPVKCTPKTNQGWSFGSNVAMNGSFLLRDASTLSCEYGCIIRVLNPLQKVITVE